MKYHTAIVKLLAASAFAGTALASPVAQHGKTEVGDVNQLAKYTVVCNYGFCFKDPFNYRCTGKGRIKKSKKTAACQASCYCESRALFGAEEGEFSLEDFAPEDFEDVEE